MFLRGMTFPFLPQNGGRKKEGEMIKIHTLKKTLSELVDNISKLSLSRISDDTKSVFVRNSISEREAAFLDFAGIKDTGDPKCLRKKIELIWRVEQRFGQWHMMENFFCYFILSYLLVIKSGWIASVYAESMAFLADLFAVFFFLFYGGRAAYNYMIYQSGNTDILLSHDIMYAAFRNYPSIVRRIATWAAILGLCYFGGMMQVFHSLISGILMLLGSEFLLREKIESQRSES